MLKFGQKLRGAFSVIAGTLGQEKRKRIFEKVKEKLDEETDSVQKIKNEMEADKEQNKIDYEKEMQELTQ